MKLFDVENKAQTLSKEPTVRSGTQERNFNGFKIE
jgi:hypothetical protein